MTVHERTIRIENSQASGGAASIGEQLRAFGLLPEREAGVIDLANPGPPRRGGHDPGVPTVLTKWEITGVFRVGHTTDFADQDAPILIFEADDVRPGEDGTGYAEGRCASCITKPFIARGEDQTLLVLEHEPGCPELGRLLALAGGPR